LNKARQLPKLVQPNFNKYNSIYLTKSQASFPFFGSIKHLPMGQFKGSFDFKRDRIFPYTDTEDFPTGKNQRFERL
jgi:hypothetical protein